MFKQLHINITLADTLILIPKNQRMLKALLSNQEKLLELANTPLNENCSPVILKKLPEKLGDPGKFLIPIARDVFVPVGKFTFPADFVIVNYDSDPRMFTDEHTLDYSSPPIYEEYDDDVFELKSKTDNAYNDSFDSKGEKIKESKLLIDELDLPRSSDFLPSPDFSLILKTRARGFVLRSPDLQILSFILGIQYPNLID
nr:reverse transcriptase domain-containing protein [Tanacetum cinerariifolium]